MVKHSQRSLADVEPSFNVKPTAEHRWPRGYTPERQAEVRSALRGTETRMRFSETGEGSPYLGSKQFFIRDPESAEGRGQWTRDIPQIHAAQDRQAERLHTDILARSKVPIEHMQNLPAIHVQPLASGALGQYFSPGQRTQRNEMGRAVPDPVSAERGRIEIDPRASHAGGTQASTTLIHELGHHLDYHANPHQFRMHGQQREGAWEASPALEGYAEGYAQGHVVPRRGEGSPGLAYREFSQRPEFQERYREASGGLTPQQHPDVAPKPQSQSTWNPHQFQQHLFVRRGRLAGDTTPDYGQHPLESWEEEPPEAHPEGGFMRHGQKPLGTIRLGRGSAR